MNLTQNEQELYNRICDEITENDGTSLAVDTFIKTANERGTLGSLVKRGAVVIITVNDGRNPYNLIDVPALME